MIGCELGVASIGGDSVDPLDSFSFDRQQIQTSDTIKINDNSIIIPLVYLLKKNVCMPERLRGCT